MIDTKISNGLNYLSDRFIQEHNMSGFIKPLDLSNHKIDYSTSITITMSISIILHEFLMAPVIQAKTERIFTNFIE